MTQTINYTEDADCKKRAALKLAKQIAEALETGKDFWNIDSMTTLLKYEIEQFKMYKAMSEEAQKTEDVSSLLSETGVSIIKKFGAAYYLKHFYFIIGKKLEVQSITETAANVAIKRAEALANIISE